MTGWRRIFNEPVMLGQLVQQGIALAVLLGLSNLNDTQQAAINAFVGLALGYIVRAFVVPTHMADSRAEQGLRPSDPREEL